MRPSHRALLLALLPFALAGLARAQAPALTLPRASPQASVSQTVGLTEIAIRYSRPAVRGRTVWGGLVPYGEVWRAGADENTTISFSTPVTVGGRRLEAGSYGLHMIPTQVAWTVILSRTATAWGSYSYDEREDAVRLDVTPQPADFRESLLYTFDDLEGGAVKAVLHWERLKVPVPIQVDVPATVAEHIRGELRGLHFFFWQPWSQAAAYALQNGGDLDQALAWADRSIEINENFANLRTRAAILEKRGDAAAASALRERAFGLATEADLNQFGYQLLGQKRTDEAVDVFKRNVAAHPGSWNVYDSLAEAYALKGEKGLAVENYRKALSMTRSEEQQKRIREELAKLGER